MFLWNEMKWEYPPVRIEPWTILLPSTVILTDALCYFHIQEKLLLLKRSYGYRESSDLNKSRMKLSKKLLLNDMDASAEDSSAMDVLDSEDSNLPPTIGYATRFSEMFSWWICSFLERDNLNSSGNAPWAPVWWIHALYESILLLSLLLLILTTQNPSNATKGHFFGKNSVLLETGTFTCSNGANLLPGKKYRP